MPACALDITILAEDTARLGGSHGDSRPGHHAPTPQHTIQSRDGRGADGLRSCSSDSHPTGMRARSWRFEPCSSAMGRWCSAFAGRCSAMPTMLTTPSRPHSSSWCAGPARYGCATRWGLGSIRWPIASRTAPGRTRPDAGNKSCVRRNSPPGSMTTAIVMTSQRWCTRSWAVCRSGTARRSYFACWRA